MAIASCTASRSGSGRLIMPLRKRRAGGERRGACLGGRGWTNPHYAPRMSNHRLTVAQRLSIPRRQELEWSNWYIINAEYYRFIVRDEASFLSLSARNAIILSRFIQRRILKNSNNFIPWIRRTGCNCLCNRKVLCH